MITLNLFDILLFESRMVLSPVQRGAGSGRANLKFEGDSYH